MVNRDNKLMANVITKIPISDIFIDNTIYPREKLDPRRIGVFAENIRDGFQFDPIEVQPHPEKPGKYRILDGAHRWNAYKSTGVTELEIIIKDLEGTDPLLYAATKAIGPEIKIFRMNRLGVPQDRIANRLGTPQKTISDHLAKKEIFPNPLNVDLSRGFTVYRVAEKHNWPLPLVWLLALEGKDDHK